MKVLLGVLVFGMLSGCGTIQRDQYPNVSFADNGDIERIEFFISQPRNPQVSLESCVVENLTGQAIQTRDYSNRRLAAALGAGLLAALVDPEEGEIDPGNLIIESTHNQVKAASWVQFSRDFAPQALRFIFTATAQTTGMKYTLTDLERLFAEAEGGGFLVPDSSVGWKPWSTKTNSAANFAAGHQKLSETVRRTQECLTFDAPSNDKG
jgi:hypothetical protein